MTLIELIKADIKANNGIGRTMILIVSYRIANWLYVNKNKLIAPVFFFYKVYYRIVINMIFGFDVDFAATIGPGLAVFHGQAVIIGSDVIIGSNVKLRQCTTIGNKGIAGSESPKIGDNVNIGAHVVIIGGVLIGNDVSIGAGSIVVKNIPDSSVVIGYGSKIVEK